jgi:very-short-patch-repair endonuclease
VLAPQDIVIVDGVPTTSCARTLLDLAEILHPEALAKALDQAEVLRIFDMRALEEVMRRNPGRHGLRPLQALLLPLHPQTKHSKNDFERLLFSLSLSLSLLREEDLPLPEVNASLIIEGRPVEPDFLWRRERLVVETDGWETHGTRQAFERDRDRDQLLLRAHYRTVRITWRQLIYEPALVIKTLRVALRAAA